MQKRVILVELDFFYRGDSSDHGPSDGPEDEYVPQQPSQHAARSSAHEPTLPRKHSQVHGSVRSRRSAPCVDGDYELFYGAVLDMTVKLLAHHIELMFNCPFHKHYLL
ncbi:hypothetical protein TNCV_3433731 [Trichonephila clavipes]|nr:hypothetical protein TNCV_3433731 [Trichonephila clavipes]